MAGGADAAFEFIQHSLWMLAQLGQHPQAVLDELERRIGTSGHVEKASRPSD